MFRLFFLILAGSTWLFGSGVALFPVVYVFVVALVFVASVVLEARRPRFHELILLAASSTLLALLLAEIGMRVVWEDRIFYRSHDTFFERSPGFRGRYRYTPHIRSERKIYGDLAAFSGDPTSRIVRRELFVTDRRGFRNSRSNSAEGVDLLILGDSFGLGTDTTQDETWAEIVGRNLNFNTLNLSLPGSPADQLYTLITEIPNISLSADAVLVWMIFAGNDLTDPYTSLTSIEHPERQRLHVIDALTVWVRNLQNRSAMPRLIASSGVVSEDHLVERRDIPLAGSMLLYRPYVQMAALTYEEIIRLQTYPLLRKTMKKMKEVATAVGLPVLIVAAPSKEEVYMNLHPQGGTTPFARALQELSRELSFDFLDLGPAMRGVAREKILFWNDDTHWNEEGNRFAAERIGTYVRTKGSLRIGKQLK